MKVKTTLEFAGNFHKNYNFVILINVKKACVLKITNFIADKLKKPHLP